MDDQRIIELYWSRAETAVSETEKKYGSYCRSIAYNILRSQEDTEECVNEAYLNTWNAIPPGKPSSLRAFLGRITRNLALNRYDYNTAQKRAGSVTIEEYYECLPATNQDLADGIVLKQAVNGFLASLPKRTRIIFLRRYWYFCTVEEIAVGMGLSQSNVKIILYRARNQFRTYLEKEGICI